MKGPAIYDADKIGQLTVVQLRKKLHDEHSFDRNLDVRLASRRFWDDESEAWMMEYVQP